MTGHRPEGPVRTSETEVAPGVFLGGWSDALGFQGRRICVREDLDPDETVPAEQVIPVLDPRKGTPDRANLDRVVAEVTRARAASVPVLLFCSHGVRRGALAAAWYLRSTEGDSLRLAFERLRKVRPQVEPVERWIRALEPSAGRA